MFYITSVNKILRHCHSWLARWYMYCNFIYLDAEQVLHIGVTLRNGYQHSCDGKGQFLTDKGD